MFVLLAQIPAAGQAPANTRNKTAVAPAPNVPAPRTPWGDPDLQGVYTFSTNTPLERPTGLAAKDTFTEAELAEIEEKATAGYTNEGPTASSTFRPFTASGNVVSEVPIRAGDVGTYNNFWTSTEKGKLTNRTALILNPENGRKPALTPKAENIRQQLVAAAAARRVGTLPYVHTLYESWTDHPTFTRCLARPMPRIWQSYNHGVQILQTPGFVAIDYESMHDVRIIPLDGRAHIDSSIRQWNGDSRGHWEGNTLVVDWTNFTDRQEFEGQPQGNMHFTERFTRSNATTISYEVTVDDPTTWTKPWTFQIPWLADDPVYQKPEDLYEYACHEGNYRMMEDTLRGTQAVKQTAPGVKK